jgi:shikimate 5-dehydrogenase|eukprot:CAMPEP_0119469416 /NCGR_PEP_ID=MMETSP1344-20130328/2753_1 /TAXON_ID=236787 /ORGANISM="Florenciella parvula, Strain CCMP2471" /LENGTH=59 /DNA_ID=CAMNT_0007501975 /DNA_START=108 /DNA_END=287 /DNA_ORIENTATION=+
MTKVAPIMVEINQEVHGVVVTELKTPRKRLRKAVVVDTVYTPLDTELLTELQEVIRPLA